MLILLLLFPTVGFIVIIAGIRGLIRYRELPKVQAEIVDFSSIRTNDGTRYSAVYSYTFNGEYIERASSRVCTNIIPRIGKIVEIALDPDSPEAPIVKSGYYIMLFVGCLFASSGLFTIPIFFQSIM